jgi:hypothetical protein
LILLNEDLFLVFHQLDLLALETGVDVVVLVVAGILMEELFEQLTLIKV